MFQVAVQFLYSQEINLVSGVILLFDQFISMPVQTLQVFIQALVHRGGDIALTAVWIAVNVVWFYILSCLMATLHHAWKHSTLSNFLLPAKPKFLLFLTMGFILWTILLLLTIPATSMEVDGILSKLNAPDFMIRAWVLGTAVIDIFITYLLVCFVAARFNIYQRKKLFLIFNIIGGITSILLAFGLFTLYKDFRGRGHPSYTRVIMDIKQIQTALELFYNDMGHFPAARVEISKDKLYCLGSQDEYGFAKQETCKQPVYMAQVPPGRQGKRKAKNCPNYITYIYRPSEDLQSYTLEYCQEEKSGGIEPGVHYATPGGIMDP